MEMSRQRLRTGVLEGSTSQCQHCQGTGIIRSTESIALAVLRGIEDVITAGANCPLIATTTPPVALYILNSKRPYVADMEARHGYSITILGSDRMQGANFTVERGAASAAPLRRTERAAVNMDWGFDGDNEATGFATSEGETAAEVLDNEESTPRERNGARGDGDEGGARRGGRRRRRRGRGGRDRDEDRERYASESNDDEANAESEEGSNDADEADHAIAGFGEQPMIGDSDHAASNGAEDKPNKRRRRGRRGGRRGRERGRESDQGVSAETSDAASSDSSQQEFDDDEPEKEPEMAGEAGHSEADQVAADDQESVIDDATPPATARKPRRRVWDVPAAANGDDTGAAPNGSSEAEPVVEIAEAKVEMEVEVNVPPPAPVRRRHEVGSSEPRIERVVVVGPGDQRAETESPAPAPQRKGWWQRKFGGE
jgi:ribonuclease E